MDAEVRAVVIGVLAVAFVSWVFGFAVYRLLRKVGLLDVPNVRSSHSKPVLRGGGIGVIVVIVVAASYCFFQGEAPQRQWWTILLVCILLLAAVSLADDVRSLSQLARFSCHALCGMLLVAYFWAVTQTVQGGTAAFAVGMLAFCWIVGYTNAFNFMDGINGLAVCQSIISGLASAAMFRATTGELASFCMVLSLIVAGAALGFLPHNFPNARMFLGDVGSIPLGFVLASLVVLAGLVHGWWGAILLSLVHANFVVDTVITFARRLARGERWFEAHCEHFYQRLVRSGKSHRFVTGTEFVLSAACAVVLVGSLGNSVMVRVAVVLLVAVVWGAFFAYSEWRFRLVQENPELRK